MKKIKLKPLCPGNAAEALHAIRDAARAPFGTFDHRAIRAMWEEADHQVGKRGTGERLYGAYSWTKSRDEAHERACWWARNHPDCEQYEDTKQRTWELAFDARSEADMNAQDFLFDAEDHRWNTPGASTSYRNPD